MSSITVADSVSNARGYSSASSSLRLHVTVIDASPAVIASLDTASYFRNINEAESFPVLSPPRTLVEALEQVTL